MSHAPGTFLLVGPLKTSSLDSVTAYIMSELQMNVTFYALNTKGQNFTNLPFPILSLFWKSSLTRKPCQLSMPTQRKKYCFDL